MPESRFSDRYVERGYNVRAMTGARLGGFALDTNAIHRGSPNGAFARDVIVVEFNARNKSRLLTRAPCGYAVEEPVWRKHKQRHGGATPQRRKVGAQGYV